MPKHNRNCLCCQAQWGEKLKVVGSCPVLGGWDVAAAPDLHWSDGHVWTQAVEVPVGAKIEYKVRQEHCCGCSMRTFEVGPQLEITT